MSSFFRNNNSPQAGYNRVPDQGRQGIPSGPRLGGQRVPPPRHDDPYEEKQYQNAPRQSAPRGSSGRFTVAECPSPALALSNCIIVNPADFGAGQHVLLNDKFPLTTKHDNTGKLPHGHIGASSGQRQWMGLSLMGDVVSLSPLPVAPQEVYLSSLYLEIGFWKRGMEATEEYSPDELAQRFIKAYNGQIFGVEQQLVFDFHGQNLRGIVKGLDVLELPGGRAPGGSPSMGIVMDNTDVNFMKAADSRIKIKNSATKAPANSILAPTFRFEDMGIGGLDSEFGAIFRRAFASRVFPPGLVDKLGIQHVKGILLFGPPGTGKTLMARQIGKVLNAREPKIINGPEILNKFVGASEENIRKLFADAEVEYKQKGDESGLHIIIFDELDAICKQRGSGAGGGTGVGDSVVNQLLSKMDGVDQLNNILLIGMTNRLDMIDEALLRPGRLEVHMEISLPDEAGRLQILNIHTAKMKTGGALNRDVNLSELATQTKNFSGAEISGLIKSATSFAMNRHVKVGTIAGISDDVNSLQVNRSDFMNALDEVHPAFGVSEEELDQVIQNGIIHFSDTVKSILHDGSLFVEQVRTSARTPLVSLLLHGPPSTGKTALAASIARASDFPFIRLVSPNKMVGLGEAQQVAAISKVFADSYKSPLSVIVLDNIERLLGWVPIGPRFSNAVLQALLILLNQQPPKGRRLLIIATTSLRPMLSDVQMSESFHSDIHVPPITSLRALDIVFKEIDLFATREERHRALGMLEQAGFAEGAEGEYEPGRLQIGIKKLLSTAETARQEPDAIAERFVNSLVKLGM